MFRLPSTYEGFAWANATYLILTNYFTLTIWHFFARLPSVSVTSTKKAYKKRLVHVVIPWRKIGMLPVWYMYTPPVKLQHSSIWYKRRGGWLTHMPRKSRTGQGHGMFKWAVPTIQSKRRKLCRFASWKIASAKISHEAGMDPPITSRPVQSNFTSLKALVKRQVVADCVLPSHSVFCELRIVVLNEAVDLGQSAAFTWRTENSISYNFDVRQRARISLSFWFLLLCFLRANFFLIVWDARRFAKAFLLILVLRSLHFSKLES